MPTTEPEVEAVAGLEMESEQIEPTAPTIAAVNSATPLRPPSRIRHVTRDELKARLVRHQERMAEYKATTAERKQEEEAIQAQAAQQATPQPREVIDLVSSGGASSEEAAERGEQDMEIDEDEASTRLTQSWDTCTEKRQHPS